MPRPSLSEGAIRKLLDGTACVAGVDAPAFVERGVFLACSEPASRVAGVDAPAFVERRCAQQVRSAPRGRVAGVDAPAFVERASLPS